MDTIRKLKGRSVTEWIGTELAVHQEEPIIWLKLSRGALQLYNLQPQFSDGSAIHIESGLDKKAEYFELSLCEVTSPLTVFQADEGDIIRCSTFSDLPTGNIESVDIAFDVNDKITQVLLTIEKYIITLSCGEVTFEGDELRTRKPQEFLIVELQHLESVN